MNSLRDIRGKGQSLDLWVECFQHLILGHNSQYQKDECNFIKEEVYLRVVHIGITYDHIAFLLQKDVHESNVEHQVSKSQ